MIIEYAIVTNYDLLSLSFVPVVFSENRINYGRGYIVLSFFLTENISDH